MRKACALSLDVLGRKSSIPRHRENGLLPAEIWFQ
ncbi:hypothetical protein U879_01870 [Defluviimonas sp. 20V17]|nr:hypothetical protein U879_01870 [Defluviimonas sp. 20V17]